MTNIYLAANLSPYVAEALNLLNRKDFDKFRVYSTIDMFGEDAEDEDIIPVIGKENGILITKDYRLKISFQYELCKQHNLGMFFFKPEEKHLKHWDIVRLLIKNWEEMMSIIETKQRPFAYYLYSRRKIKEFK
ncbi:MAG: hypothetical protein L0Y79_02395 [Chlorobi bacterium]|nr:hypothetical protein [Chlorobiota bacterium]MCI0717127.1 hypothetical protein [Chlorobiota bacterium]